MSCLNPDETMSLKLHSNPENKKILPAYMQEGFFIRFRAVRPDSEK